MSSIKDLLDQEKESESMLRDSEQKSESMLRDARATAAELIRKAQSEDALLRELTARNKERIASMRQDTLSECEARAADSERLCRSNLEAAVRLIIAHVAGEDNER